MNIVDLVLFQCRQQPPAAAICVPGPGIGLISYRRLEQFIHNISRRVLSLGLSPGSTVAVKIDDVIFHSAVLLALARLGITTLSLRENVSSLPFRIDALVSDAKLPAVQFDRVVLCDLSWTEGDGRPVERQYLPVVSDNDICRLILTSGTTGVPKAVAVSHRLLSDRIGRHLTVFGNRLPRCDRVYSDMPLSTSLGFQFLIYTLWRGGTAFFPGDRFDSTLQAIEEYKVQCVVAPPSGLETLLRWYEVVAAYQSNLEVIVCGGDVLSRTLSARVRSRICSHLIAAYGSTEASMTATAHAQAIDGKPGAVGYVTPGNVVQIVDRSGAVLPPGQEGHVRIRSDYAVDSYLGNPEESAKVFRDGWFHPGDIGTLDADDLLVITGREQTVLNVGGDKINPELVERVLSAFPDVVDAGVFSAPNDLGNNEVCAAIVGREGIDLQKLRAHCEAHLPPGYLPSKVFLAQALPRNEMGKIDRPRLAELARQPVSRR
jgi:acyl-coenzyme A synthetase/AMP-(fatty) acid ligase